MPEELTYVDKTQDSRIAKLEESLAELQIEVAEKRSIGEIVRYGAIIIIAIGGLFSFLGYSSYSEIKQSIEGQVEVALRDHIKREISISQAEMKEFLEFVAATETNMVSYNTLLERYKQRLGEVDKIYEISTLEDIEGELSRIEQEISHRFTVNPSKGDVLDFNGTVFEKNWRLGVVSRLQELSGSPDKIARVDPDKWFNFLQTLRRAGINSVTYQLIEALPNDPGKPSIEALRLMLSVERSIGSERDASFEELMEMVRLVDEVSPHIIIAEAWNAAETLRRYTSLIDALKAGINRRRQEGLPPISYLHVILAEAYVRRGFSGDKQSAQQALQEARVIVQTETSGNQWQSSTLMKISELTPVVR